MEVTFTLNFESDVLPQNAIDDVIDYIYEYCAIGAFTDDINVLLNAKNQCYLIGNSSGADWFKFFIFPGTDSPSKKDKLSLSDNIKLSKLNP